MCLHEHDSSIMTAFSTGVATHMFDNVYEHVELSETPAFVKAIVSGNDNAAIVKECGVTKWSSTNNRVLLLRQDLAVIWTASPENFTISCPEKQEQKLAKGGNLVKFSECCITDGRTKWIQCNTVK